MLEIDSPSRSVRTDAMLVRARWSTRVQFMALGAAAGTWGAHIPSLKASYGLSEASLSLVLLAAGIGTIGSLLLAGRIVGRFGARAAAGAGALVMSLMLGMLLGVPGLAALVGAALVFGAAASLFDVAINTEGSALEALGGRAVMSNLHGMFSVGGMTGAAVASLLLDAGIAPRVQLFAVALAIAVVTLGASRGMLETHAGSDDDDDGAAKSHFVWPTGVLLAIGLLVFAGMTAEGVMYDWCVLYLNQELGMPQASAALGYATFSAAMALTRFGGDALRARHSERKLLRAGALLATVTMAAVLLIAHAWAAMIGFAVVGAGLALVAPILFNAATRVPGVSRAAAIAAVTSVGYSGFMIGPPLIGAIATATSLTLALGVVVVAAALLTFGAHYVPEARRPAG